jgi:hypothetical protein
MSTREDRAPPRRRALRISGRSALIVLAVLAAGFAVALYWALIPLYRKGGEGLRTRPAEQSAPATEESTPEPAPERQP